MRGIYRQLLIAVTLSVVATPVAAELQPQARRIIGCWSLEKLAEIIARDAGASSADLARRAAMVEERKRFAQHPGHEWHMDLGRSEELFRAFYGLFRGDVDRLPVADRAAKVASMLSTCPSSVEMRKYYG